MFVIGEKDPHATNTIRGRFRVPGNGGLLSKPVVFAGLCKNIREAVLSSASESGGSWTNEFYCTF